MAGMRLTAEDRAALEVLIESLNGDGYLADALDEIAERLAEMLGIDADEDEAREELMTRLQCALNGCTAWSRWASARATWPSA